MPRTKQTAKKSTGAHSQRVILVKPQSIKNKKLQTQTAIITPKADPHDVVSHIAYFSSCLIMINSGVAGAGTEVS